MNTHDIPPGFETLFPGLTDTKCSQAQQEQNPLPCEFSQVANLKYCKVHGVVAPKTI
jgi:hypothetical protein